MGPCIERIETAAYTIPTDFPESDGTLEWDSTTLLVRDRLAGSVAVGPRSGLFVDANGGYARKQARARRSASRTRTSGGSRIPSPPRRTSTRAARGAASASPSSESMPSATPLEAELRRRVAGEVRFDDGSRGLYATDASNYRQVPIGVVVPRTVEDAVETVAACVQIGKPADWLSSAVPNELTAPHGPRAPGPSRAMAPASGRRSS